MLEVVEGSAGFLGPASVRTSKGPDFTSDQLPNARIGSKNGMRYRTYFQRTNGGEDA